MCTQCGLFLADEEFHGCCSQSCLNDMRDYMADLDLFYAADHATHWSEL